MRKLPAAACVLAAIAISQIVTGANPPGDQPDYVVCTPGDSCELKGSLSAVQPTVLLPEPQAVAVLPPENRLEQVAAAKPPVVLPETPAESATTPRPAPVDLAPLTPEPLAEPEPPPTTAAEPQPWVGRWRPITVSFAYSNSHPLSTIEASALEPTAPAVPWTDAMDASASMMPLDAQAGVTRGNTSRLGLCSAIVSAARGNDLPVPFFANLIWQESNFRLGEISNAGALGVAQFIPETAHEHGLINPFEPIHAIFASAKLLRRLTEQYRNLGFAAAAYNAGPGRVNDWLTRHRALPGETRAYVHIITGHTAARWASTEFKHDFERTVLPAKAPCPEVAEEVAARMQQAHVAKLMKELAAATAPPPKPVAPPADAMAMADDKAAKPHGMKDQSKPQSAPSVLEVALARAAAGATTSSEPAVASARAVAAKSKAKSKSKVQPKPQPPAATVLAKVQPRSQIKSQTNSPAKPQAKSQATAQAKSAPPPRREKRRVASALAAR